MASNQTISNPRALLTWGGVALALLGTVAAVDGGPVSDPASARARAAPTQALTFTLTSAPVSDATDGRQLWVITGQDQAHYPGPVTPLLVRSLLSPQVRSWLSGLPAGAQVRYWGFTPSAPPPDALAPLSGWNGSSEVSEFMRACKARGVTFLYEPTA